MVNELRIEYTDKSVTAWGGMKLMKELVKSMGIKEFMQGLSLPVRGSNRGYNPVDIVESFMVSVWIGANRFSHSGLLRYDSVLREIFGWKQSPSQSTFSRFFHKFSWKRNAEVFPSMQKWFFEQLTIDNITVDLDSTVITRYGDQEGTAKGYNPSKPGRNSHHPLMAFVAETRMVVNAWMRPGNTVALSSSKTFLDETFEILDKKRVGLLRADSGFFADDLLKYFEAKNLNYITAVKLFAPIKRELGASKKWISVDKGIEICEWTATLDSWGNSRRFIAVRRDTKRLPKASGTLLLFPEQQTEYRYSVYVTNLDLPAMQVWTLYRQRGDAENRIKELKADFGIDSFCLSKFWATEAAFRFTMVAYNLLSLFRQIVLRQRNHSTLATLRFKCFALGAWVTAHSGKRILKLSIARQRRSWLDGLFDIVRANQPPFTFSNA